ncbi:sugar phosphate isomerase/epimerase family protein [Pseudomonas fluorescens]|uniref:sugar phosphate isomerase/epimerase family protein n=1 Tax=Pseudomonas fluorescens TaxID=294 RepID=UPI00259BD66A|nr:TIM barrel protein [Pseudomonas fluorescens]WJK08340.1 TIM barrel protein [Pseudomonas fluorescens]
MRLAISNIAWDVVEDEDVAKLLNRFGVNAIDIAPGKYFPEPTQATDEDICRVKDWWAERGIEITGMQALLFGTSGLNVFGSTDTQAALLKHLDAVCRIGGSLGATRVVFGSPKNRDRSGLSDEETLQVAIPFFRQLGDIAQNRGVTICLEPNPECYGANFMTASAETANVVTQVAHPAIRMQLDTGAVTINKEEVQSILELHSELIGHVHASEPDLLPLGEGGTAHAEMAKAVARYLPNHIVSIEMVATKDEPHLISMERSLLVAVQHYRMAVVEVGR